MRLLDLYSGTHSVGDVARALGYEVVSLDLRDADICCDVLSWDFRAMYGVGHFDVVWASPPCETFSHARYKNVGRFGITRESIEADIVNRGLPLLRKTEEIIDYFQPRYYFIENPRQRRYETIHSYGAIPWYYVVDYWILHVWF